MSLTMLASIQSNDPSATELRFDASPAEYFSALDELLDALAGNSVIEYLRFDSAFLPGLSADQKSALFQVVGKIPSLKELFIYGGSVGLVDVGKAISNASGLTVVSLGNVQLEGNQADATAFGSCLQGHASLEAFTMIDFKTEEGVLLDDVIKAVSGLAKLDMVKIDSGWSGSTGISPTALVSLFQSPCVSELSIAGFSLETANYVEIATLLQSEATKLKVLQLVRAGLEPDSATALAAGLAGNKSLERLDLSSNKISDAGCIALADGLRANTSIKVVRLFGNKEIGDDGLLAMAEMLEQNNTIERLETPYADSQVRIKIEERLGKNRGTATAA